MLWPVLSERLSQLRDSADLIPGPSLNSASTLTGVPVSRAASLDNPIVRGSVAKVVFCCDPLFVGITAGVLLFASESLAILAPYPKFCWSRVPTRTPTRIHLVEAGQIAVVSWAAALFRRYRLTEDHVFRIRSVFVEVSCKLPMSYLR